MMKKFLISFLLMIQVYGANNEAMSSNSKITKEFLRSHITEINHIVKSNERLNRLHQKYIFSAQSALNEMTDKIKLEILLGLSSGQSYDKIILLIGGSDLPKREKLEIGYSFLLIFLHEELGKLRK